MGYLVNLSVTRGDSDLDEFRELPQSLPWKIYSSDVCSARFIDVFNYRKGLDWPFTSVPAVDDLNLQFDTPHEFLNELYSALKKKNRADGFRRAFVNLNLMLSNLSSTEILSIISDDEGIDLACISNMGELKKLRFRAGGIEVNWTEAEGMDMEKKSKSRLHNIVEQEVFEFLKFELPLFGFDANAEELKLKTISSSPPLPPPKPRPPRGGWEAYKRKLREQKTWWQFWK